MRRHDFSLGRFGGGDPKPRFHVWLAQQLGISDKEPVRSSNPSGAGIWDEEPGQPFVGGGAGPVVDIDDGHYTFSIEPEEDPEWADLEQFRAREKWIGGGPGHLWLRRCPNGRSG